MIRELFSKYKYQLNSFSNSEYGKWFLQDTFGGKIEKDDFVFKVTPDGFHVIKDRIKNKFICQATFYPRSPYIKKFANILTGLELLYTHKDFDMVPEYRHWNENGFRNLSMATLTVNPDANVETTTVDGYVKYDNSGSPLTWANIIIAAGTHAGPSEAGTGVETVGMRSHTSSNDFNLLLRSIYLFDTSSLTASASISSAIMSIYYQAKGDALTTTPDINIYTSTPASNTDLVASDFSQIGSIAQATAITYAGWTAAQYNDFTLNGTGIGNINKTGVTKFGARNANRDVAASAPTWGSNQFSYIQGLYADNGSNKPKLVVTYTIEDINSFPFISV